MRLGEKRMDVSGCQCFTNDDNGRDGVLSRSVSNRKVCKLQILQETSRFFGGVPWIDNCRTRQKKSRELEHMIFSVCYH